MSQSHGRNTKELTKPSRDFDILDFILLFPLPVYRSFIPDPAGLSFSMPVFPEG